MTVARLLLALDRSTEDRLLPDIVQYGHAVLARVSGAGELLAALDRTEADVALVSAGRATLSAAVVRACDEHGVRVIALAVTDQDRRNAAGLGLLDVIDATADWAGIEAVIEAGVVIPLRVTERASSLAAPARGTVIAVWGPSGAPGRTTLAINVAAEIAAAGHTVALVDVDSYGGGVAPALGMLDESPGFAAACRLAGTGSLTRPELERIAQRYTSPRGAFWVLTGIGRPSRWPELSGERVSKTIEVVRNWVDYVVLDTGFSLESDEEISSDLFAPRRNAATLTTLRSADHVVACGLADPVGLARFLRSWAELAEAVSTDRVSVVMNRVRPSAVGIDANRQVIAALRRFGGIHAPFLVPHDQAGADAAVLTGRTLRDAAPKSPARTGILRLVQREILPEPVAARSRGVRRMPWRRRATAL
ncbi:regulator [Cryobacterium sp. ZS14-85]|uniref:Regulator n=1 Tax=Cryobacterium zhongshanensis TaxID=2928153 RepID=A0AA41R0V0_9MICO|nr:regulator [Cryobacterium zhongshanensis]MCI4659938.1 regulator [Cryobacterium zhongshanensis]